MPTPINVQLVAAPGCSKCIEVKEAITRALDQLNGDYPIELTELNLPDHPELTDRYEIWSTPALIINDELAFHGRVGEQELREKLAAASHSTGSES